MIQRFFGTSVNVDFQRSLNGLQAILQLGQLAMHLRRTSARSAKEKESFIDTLERYSFACAHVDASDMDLALLDAATQQLDNTTSCTMQECIELRARCMLVHVTQPVPRDPISCIWMWQDSQEAAGPRRP